jgi:hypothetical protein
MNLQRIIFYRGWKGCLMIPGIERLNGKGHASRGIHAKIISFLPRHYLPILREVSPAMNVLVRSGAYRRKASVPLKKSERRRSQSLFLKSAIETNDVKILSYFDTEQDYDFANYTEFAFQVNANVDTLEFVVRHDTALNNDRLLHFIAHYERLDLFERLDSFTWNDQALIGIAVSDYVLWPLEFMQKKGYDIVTAIALDRWNAHEEDSWPHYRRVILFMLQHSKLEMPSTHANRTVALSEMRALLSTCFIDCCKSDRKSDVALFSNLYGFLNNRFKFVDWLPVFDDNNNNTEEAIPDCLSWLTTDFKNVPAMMKILKRADCGCGTNCARYPK